MARNGETYVNIGASTAHPPFAGGALKAAGRAFENTKTHQQEPDLLSS
jgi:hypothetical protein